ncbi:MAG: glutamyl-tRNA amidotransferase [Pelagibacteraceae bacterium]|nr:glutamyl-tRNA amidotransferase [Pelagibacteraceae bacterium]|tara:strand:- start:6329 stop:6790 length:462 start_codon:yes stop_codon:yes gene_type:complete
MSLRELIDNDYKQSIKNKEQDKTNTLRLIKSAIKDKDISSRSASNNEVIKDTEILTLLLNLIKQRKDSIEQFQKANREDLIEREQNEIDIIGKYLPKQKSIEETENIVNDLIKKHKLESIKEMGKLMGLIKKNYAGEVDMGLVGKIAKSKFEN